MRILININSIEYKEYFYTKDFTHYNSDIIYVSGFYIDYKKSSYKEYFDTIYNYIMFGQYYLEQKFFSYYNYDNSN